MSDRVLRFPDRTWDELEALPQPLRNTAHRAIFHLLDEPVPALAEPFPETDPLPGAYRLHLPSDGLTIWYTVTETREGRVVIVVQYVKAVILLPGLLMLAGLTAWCAISVGACWPGVLAGG